MLGRARKGESCSSSFDFGKSDAGMRIQVFLQAFCASNNRSRNHSADANQTPRSTFSFHWNHLPYAAQDENIIIIIASFSVLLHEEHSDKLLYFKVIFMLPCWRSLAKEG
jgi:hypothetical protein